MVVISPWIGDKMGYSISWQTPPWQPGIFGALPILWCRKHSPGSLYPTSALTAPLSWAKSPCLCCWVPLHTEAWWHLSSSSCMAHWSTGLCSISLGDSVICKQKRGKLKGEEGKGLLSSTEIPEPTAFGKTYVKWHIPRDKRSQYKENFFFLPEVEFRSWLFLTQGASSLWFCFLIYKVKKLSFRSF